MSTTATNVELTIGDKAIYLTSVDAAVDSGLVSRKYGARIEPIELSINPTDADTPKMLPDLN